MIFHGNSYLDSTGTGLLQNLCKLLKNPYLDDMKEFLPIIIGFLYFAFHIYSNYKKEQEKAQKRNPSIPVGEATPTKTVEPLPSEPRRSPSRFPADYPVRPSMESPMRPSMESPTRLPVPSVKLEREKPSVPSIKRERYQTMKKEVELPEEVLKLRAFKEQKRRELEKKSLRSNLPGTPRSLSVEIMDAETHQAEREEFIQIDLRQAVIHSIILERKY